MPHLFITLLIILYGLVIGSFLNVCIYRIPLGKTVVKGRSYCPNCGNPIPWYRNIPLLSFLLLRGCCKDCHEPISIRYPIVEALNALLWFIAWLQYGPVPDAALVAALSSLLLVISFIDFEHQIIPDGLVLIILILGLTRGLLATFVYHEHWSLWILGFFAASLPLYLMGLFYHEGMGGGDIKLMAATGLFAGWKLILLSLFLASLFALFYAGILVLRGKKLRKIPIPFGPFLSLGILASLFLGDNLIAFYLSIVLGS